MLFSLMLFSELTPPLRHHLRNRTPDKCKFSAGLTPLHVATLNGDTAIAQVLAQSGADATIPVCIQSMHEHHRIYIAVARCIISGCGTGPDSVGNDEAGQTGEHHCCRVGAEDTEGQRGRWKLWRTRSRWNSNAMN